MLPLMHEVRPRRRQRAFALHADADVASQLTNGMAEAFVRSLNNGFVRASPTTDGRPVIKQLAG